MISDIRVLNRERFNRENRPAGAENRHLRRELERLAKRHGDRVRLARVLPSQETKGVKGENTEAKPEGLVQMPNPPGFVRGRAGLLVSAILAAELAAAGCGSVVYEDDVMDADVPADVQPDVEDDSASPDVHDVDVEEDGALDADEGSPDVHDEGSVDMDAEDVHEAEDGDSHEGMDDAGPDEADVPVCEPITYTETRPAESAGTICGSTREKVVTVQVTEYGEGCETVGTETSLESIEYRITPPLDYSGERDPLGGLVCARGNETELLNSGTHMVIQLSPTEIHAAYKLASALNMTAGSPPLNGGTYQLRLTDVSGTVEALNRLLDAAGTFTGEEVLSPGQGRGGFVVIDPSNGAFAWNLWSSYASQAIIRLEGGNVIVIRNPGSLMYEVPGDEGWFETRILAGSGASEIAGYGFYRDRHKK